MNDFKSIDDIEAWLEPMDYAGFWYAVAPYDLVLQPKSHCDQQIAAGEADEALVLDMLKYFARLELTKRLNLSWRTPAVWLQAVQ
jgi:hypothetical protein